MGDRAHGGLSGRVADGGRIREKLADVLEMPRELVMDFPRITMVGNAQALIENHKGLIEYTSNKVRVSVSLGELVLSGANLVIARISSDEIAVEGSISSVSFTG